MTDSKLIENQFDDWIMLNNVLVPDSQMWGFDTFLSLDILWKLNICMFKKFSMHVPVHSAFEPHPYLSRNTHARARVICAHLKRISDNSGDVSACRRPS